MVQTRLNGSNAIKLDSRLQPLAEYGLMFRVYGVIPDGYGGRSCVVVARCMSGKRGLRYLAKLAKGWITDDSGGKEVAFDWKGMSLKGRSAVTTTNHTLVRL